MNLSHRLSTIPASPIRKLIPFAEQAKKQGVTVYRLNIGDPDIKTPEVMLTVLRQWDISTISYAQSKGDPEFLSALAWYYQRCGYPFITEHHIQVTSGGSEAIGMAMVAVCNPGDSLLVFEPFYANYQSIALLYDVRLVPIQTSLKNGFHLPDRSTIERYIDETTKGILLCNPNNPTGTVYRKDELTMLVSLAKDRDLFLLSDEVYREFVYDGRTHVSLLSYANELPEQIIVLDSVSKRYSLCGARLGALISINKELLDGVLRIAQGRLSSGFVDQKMAAKLVNVPDSYMQRVREEYEQRRNVVYEGLRSINGVGIHKPEGAFYTVVSLPVENAEMFCQWLLTDFRLEQETVMLAPANGFYLSEGKGKNEVRLAYVLEIPKLKRAIQILAKALDAW